MHGLEMTLESRLADPFDVGHIKCKHSGAMGPTTDKCGSLA
jgi:hypothetical protein